MNYADAYELVSRWTEGTLIEYSAEVNKSGEKLKRYSRYARAISVGEAWALGSTTMDMIIDLKNGYITVIGGPVRDDVMENDLLEADMTERLTETDCAIFSLYRTKRTASSLFRIGDRLGLGCCCLELRSAAASAESKEMHAARLEAQVQAKNALDAAKYFDRKVADREVVRVLRCWAFRPHALRSSLARDKRGRVYSDTLGLVSSASSSSGPPKGEGADPEGVPAGIGDFMITEATRMYPAVLKLLTRWLQDHWPADVETEFPFTSVTITRGEPAKRHRDGFNTCPSAARAFGQFHGGEFSLWPEDTRHKPVVDLRQQDRITRRIHRGFMVYDPSRAHSIEDFDGERFGVTFITHGRYRETTPAIVQELQSYGVVFPTDASLNAVRALLARGDVDQGQGASSFVYLKDGAEADDLDPVPALNPSVGAATKSHGFFRGAVLRAMRLKTETSSGAEDGVKEDNEDDGVKKGVWRRR